ncbi:DNA adenine methylase [Acinetobacter baumannii]|uniref:DNA adenine methylase n=1 Tax=Acinetobacter baumannii TaxID=470 RepID=UPI0030BC6CD1
MQHPLFRYHGGKFRLASWIISHFPHHDTYVEAFGGAASVLLEKKPSRIEVYNDIDDEIVNFFRILRCPIKSKQLKTLIENTPYSRSEFLYAKAPCIDEIERARRLVVKAQMGFGSTGSTKSSTGFRSDTARGCTDLITIWNRQGSLIEEAAARFKKVMIEKRDALQVIRDHDRPETLFFLDPPYLHECRKLGGDAYTHEMTNEQHEELIDLLRNVQGKVILCGYDNDLYDQLGWKKVNKSVSASGQNGSVGRQEILWINPQAEKQQDLFTGLTA